MNESQKDMKQEVVNEATVMDESATEAAATTEETVDVEETLTTEEVIEEVEAQEVEKKSKKKPRVDKKQEKMQAKVTELEDKVKRQMAEFENFRKRSEKEKAVMFDMGAKNIVEKMLPIVDNFERGLQSITDDQKGSFYEGMEMIYKQMMTGFEQMGVTPIPAVGEEFNPDYHNAVMQVESEEYESGIVAQELQKGYQYNETVVRHSMVAVVQ